MSELDLLLDCTLDDLADLPSFKPFPPGAHKVSLSVSTKEVNNKPGVEALFKYIEPLELENLTDVPPAAGDECSSLFFLDNEIGQGKLKQFAKPIMLSQKWVSLKEFVEGAQSLECIIISRTRVDKNDPTRLYMDVKEISVV